MYIRVHEDHEQIFDDVLGQKATVTKDLYHKNRNFLWFRKLHLCLPFMTNRGERGSGTDTHWDNETRRKRKRETRERGKRKEIERDEGEKKRGSLVKNM